ncbi:hypothetical protein QJQ45_020442 [Haematococcus lacustris]|nr:hypothetical protein QJQ45_020442 [Haematococcus lacustris]
MGCGSSTAGAISPSGDRPGDKLAATIFEGAGDVREKYTFDKVLGKGNFGVVHLVFDKKTGESMACKSISKRKLVTPDDIEDVRREVQILLHLSGHKNVVQLKGTYEDKSYIHLVMEVCEGGELFDRIAEKGHFSEKSAAEVMRTIVSVVNHCHTMNVIHRDLKPENFLLTSKKDGAILKATDFGLSRFFKEGQLLDEIVGSPFYVAPEASRPVLVSHGLLVVCLSAVALEDQQCSWPAFRSHQVLRRQYGKEADIWSCGVILYILLCGWPPFHGENTQQIFKHIMSQPLDQKSDPWPRISDAAKDCVRRMLARDPKKRLTAEQVLSHPWMKVNGVAPDEMIPEVLTRMRQFTQMNKLKKEALKVFARSLPANELVGLKEMFQAIDEDNSGTISVDELREGLRKKGTTLALQEVQRIMDNIDVNGNSRIDYEEFLAATMHITKLNKEDNMIEAFRHFDKDNSGFITKDEIITALREVGEEPDEVEVQTIIKSVDKNGDGTIDYEEFCVMMRNNDAEMLRTATHALKSRMVIAPKMTQSFSAKLREPLYEEV